MCNVCPMCLCNIYHNHLIVKLMLMCQRGNGFGRSPTGGVLPPDGGYREDITGMLNICINEAVVKMYVLCVAA